MFYHEYPAPPELGEHIQCFWTLEHDYRDSFHTHEHLWADTQIEVIFSYGERYYQKKGRGRDPLPANFVIGPFKKELLLYSEAVTGFVAVRFHPWGFAPFSTVPMTELINTILSAESVLGEVPSLPGQPATGGVARHFEIIGNWLLQRLKRQQQRPTPVQALAKEIQSRKGVVKISELTAAFGINPRRLERLFIKEIGMSAKLFARILRFNHAKGMIERNPDISLASLTYETGYADQAHFSHNFREMFGYTPAQFKTLMRKGLQNAAGQVTDVVFLQDNF